MVIAQLSGGLGNQFYQYACARCLAHKLNTELKLDTHLLRSSVKLKERYIGYFDRLINFNVQHDIATPEEIKRVTENGVIPPPLPDLENFQGDILIKGNWMHKEKYFVDIIDIIRKEFTLKKPFNPIAETWHQKILSSECSVSMHFRHGDFAYSLEGKGLAWAPLLPLDYYRTCVEILKQRYGNITVFVFSDNLPWVKENLHLDVPTEFVEGCETDDEEWILMSLCKHNVTSTSTFALSSVSLNTNPDKKIFHPMKSNAKGVKEFLDSLTPEKKELLLNTKGWILVPYDFDNQAKITQRPIFSLLLVVNDDATTIAPTLDSLLTQDYNYYEVVIIDNASTDGSGDICRQAAKGKANVTLKKFDSKVSNAVAWNMAFKAAQGKYVSFLKSGDRFIPNSLTSLYRLNEYRQSDIIHLFAWLAEDENGTIDFVDKKYSERRDARLKKEKASFTGKDGLDAAKLLLNQQINSFLGTKFFYCDFLKDNGIKFNEQVADKEAEILFQKEAFSKTNYIMYAINAFYVAPKN